MSAPRPHWLYTGLVMHRRLRPVEHGFRYGVFFLRFPLSRLAQLRGPLFALDRFNLFSFHRADHGDGGDPLQWIGGLLRREGVREVIGEVELQTFPRVLGYVFNPVSFWYCHNTAGELIAILAEVNNTFGERHCYLLQGRGTDHPQGRAAGRPQGVPRLAVLRHRGRLPLPLCRCQRLGRRALRGAHRLCRCAGRPAAHQRQRPGAQPDQLGAAGACSSATR